MVEPLALWQLTLVSLRLFIHQINVGENNGLGTVVFFHELGRSFPGMQG